MKPKTMTVFANLFLLMFLADGCISSLDEVVSLLTAIPALTLLREAVAASAMLLSFVIYTLLSFDRRLPKRVFIPLVFFIWLIPVVGPLFPATNGVAWFGLLASLAQILVFLLATLPFRKSGGCLLREEMLQGPVFRWQSTLGFAAANLVISPVFFMLMVFSSVNGYLQKNTSGFMHLSPSGLHMAEKVYRRGDKTVRLISMIHVGEKQYYETVLKQPQPGRTVILAEGVTDDKRLLQNRLDYGKFAGYFGLTTQGDHMQLKGRVIDAGKLDEGVPQNAGSGKNGLPDIVRADVDISSFRPSTVWFLDELGKQMKQGGTVSEQLVASAAWYQNNVTPQIEQTLLDDILHRRNRELIGHLHKALKHYDVVVIPWGAMHMTEVEGEVLAQGFKLAQVNDRVSIHFGRR